MKNLTEKEIKSYIKFLGYNFLGIVEGLIYWNITIEGIEGEVTLTMSNICISRENILLHSIFKINLFLKSK